MLDHRVQSWLPATQSRAKDSQDVLESSEDKKYLWKGFFSLNGIIIDKYSCSKIQNQKDEGTRIIKICPLPLIVCSNQQWISCAVILNPKDKMHKLIRTYTKIMGITPKLTEPNKSHSWTCRVSRFYECQSTFIYKYMPTFFNLGVRLI